MYFQHSSGESGFRIARPALDFPGCRVTGHALPRIVGSSHFEGHAVIHEMEEGKLKRFLLALGLMVTLAAPAFGRGKALPDVTFPDGATGTVTAECGVADLCASLKLPGGDSIEVYNEGGAGYCQPYMLSIIRLRGTTVLLKSETESASKKVKEGMQKFTCAQFVSTYLTFDAGVAKLGLFLSKDGTLFGEWSISKSDTTKP